jgi:hypothetical protein
MFIKIVKIVGIIILIPVGLWFHFKFVLPNYFESMGIEEDKN